MLKGQLLSYVQPSSRPMVQKIKALIDQRDLKKNKYYTVSGFTDDHRVMVVESGYVYSLDCFQVA